MHKSCQEKRLTPSVLCDKNVQSRLKDKFYRMQVRPVMLYGTKCWPVQSVHTRRRDMIRDEVIQNKVEVAPMTDKMKEVSFG